MNEIRGVKRVYETLKQLKYASLFDRRLALNDFENHQLGKATMIQEHVDDATILTYNVKYESNTLESMIDAYATYRVVIYEPENLAYTLNSRIYTAEQSHTLYNPPEPAIPWYSFENSDYFGFRFIRFDTDVFLDSRIKHQILSVIQNVIVNYLTNNGIGCFIDQFGEPSRISLFVPSQYRNRLFDYLRSFDWQKLMMPFNHLFSKLKVKTTGNHVQTFDLSTNLPTEFNIEINYRGDLNDIEIKLDFNDVFFFQIVDKNNNDYDAIDGWRLMPQLKPLYTDKRFTTNPITDFVIFGKVPQIAIHEKYLPILRAGVIKVFGIRINGTEYWFKEPIYADRFYKPRRHEESAWNTFVAKHLL
jgi:hypothetical protein